MIAAFPEVRFVSPRQEAQTQSRPTTITGLSPATNVSSPAGFYGRAARVRAQLLNALPMVQKSKFGQTNVITAVNVSEGDKTHRGDSARATFGFNGTGVKVGVLSDGVSSLASVQASGDLGPVTVLPGQAGSGDEGTAMLEIVHDLAPGAQLFFATAFNGITSFAQNIRDLRTAGCDIIVDDVIYFVETPMQDGQAPAVTSNTNGGVVIQAVNDVTAAGALYFSSAGNEGGVNKSTASVWEGDFVDGGANALIPGGTVHNFGGGNLNDLITTAGARALLFWSDPLGGSSNDYDLFVLNNAATAVVASSTNVQNGTQDPVEDAGNRTSGQRLVIFKKTEGTARFLHLNAFGAGMALTTSGNTHGHNHALNAYSVAATPAAATPFGGPPGPFPNPFSSVDKIETFSSDGPRRILYNADSSAITPGNVSSTGGLLRQKPDITAADGVSCAAPGFNPFFGTSAAAPHAAAIAALVKSAAPSATPAQIRTALVSSAIDIEGAGVDRDSGAGIVMAFQALQAIGAVPSPVITSAGATIVSESCTPANGVIDAGETVTVSFCVQNTGGANTTNLVGTLQATGGVTTPSGPQNYGVVTFGGPPVCRNFTFTASGACGSTITATIQFQDGATNLGNITYTFTLGTPIVGFSENFDGVTAPNLPAGWTASQGVNSAGAPFWVTSTATPDTAPNAIFTPDPNNLLDNRIDTPSIAVTTATAQLTFRNNFNLEDTFDGGVLEISNPAVNAGAFQDIITAGGSFGGGGYTGTISVNFASPIAGRQAWTGNSGGFITTTVNLPASANGQNIVLRWRRGSDSSVSGVGAFIDTISITGSNCGGGAPCTITCPANVTAVTNQAVCPSPACTTVTFPNPVATDNCPGVTVACVPPSGGCFNIGVTTVTCTATDTSGNTATCSFTVTTFDVALQDDSIPGTICLWNSQTGQYRFCCGGTTFTGVGKVQTQGCVYTLSATPSDRRVQARVDKAAHAGSASIQTPPGTTRCTITDRDTRNNTNLTQCQ